MWRRIIAAMVALSVPAAASAGPGTVGGTPPKSGPVREAIEKAGRDLASAKQSTDGPSRKRFWTGISLVAGGAALGALSKVELGDDEVGPDDGEDVNGSDDGEDSDGWGNKAMLGGGIAAATVGGVLLLTGGKKSGPVVSVKRGGFAVRQTIRF